MREPAHEHQCTVCDKPARLWVDIGLSEPEPLCRGCAAKVAGSDTIKQALVELVREPEPRRLPQPLDFPKPPPPKQRNPRHPARTRRKCSQCPLVTNVPGLALHQRYSGHTGYEEVTP